MIKQVIMPILVIEEPGMTRRDNRPYYQKNVTYNCLTTELFSDLRCIGEVTIQVKPFDN